MKKTNMLNMLMVFILTGCGGIYIDGQVSSHNFSDTAISTGDDSTYDSTDSTYDSTDFSDETATSTSDSSSIEYGDVIHTPSNELIENLTIWGLGNAIIRYSSLYRPYDYYINQIDTGTYGSSNCGPTSVVMAGKFYNPDYSYSVEDLRATNRPTGGWWYENDIIETLERTNVPFRKYLYTEELFSEWIDDGKIYIINPSMTYVAMNYNQQQRTNRYYSGVTGHYLIIKGYIETDIGFYYEVYDPYGVAFYDNNVSKGKDRYFEKSGVFASLDNWYRYVYVING
jgi:hypothetical protein